MRRRSPITTDLAGHRAAERRRIDRMAFWLAVVASALLAAVLFQVVWLQVAPSDRLRIAAGQHISIERFDAPRGDIHDRRGRLLAASRIADRLILDPLMFRVDGTMPRRIHDIAEAIDADPDELAARIIDTLSRTMRSYHDTGRFVRYTPLSAPLTDRQSEAIRALRIQGLHLEPIPLRERMVDDTLATIVGRLGSDDRHTLGMESRHAGILTAERGSIAVVRDGRRRTMWAVRDRITPARAGEPVRASIDLRIQQIAREELGRAVRETDAAGGRCLIVDPATGEVLAMVDIVAERDDLVPFDPKDPEHLRPRPGHRQRFQIIPTIGDPTLDPAVRRNRLIHDQYEPGSIFKPFVWAAVTAKRAAKLDESFTVNHGSWRTPYGRTIRDVVDTFKDMSWRDVLVRSSNIGMAQGAARLSRQDLRATVLAYGFGSPTGLAIPGERPGMVTSQRNWNDYSQTSVSFGQEIAVTPAQMVRAFCAFARSGPLAGTLPELTLTALAPADASAAPAPAPQPVIDAWTVYQTRDALAETAANVRRRARQLDRAEPASLYTSFGKTGTAQVARPGTRGYFERQYISSYIAGAPLDHPRIVLLVTIDDPGPARIAARAHYGSATAGPAAMRIIDRTLAYLGLPPDGEAASSARLAAGR